jgi:anaerobic selenocysteine-containing dehydrogenase
MISTIHHRLAALAGALTKTFRQWEGPLTRELLLSPGKFGLGKVPERLQPDAVTTAICGFCSTGCGLQIHLREGQAINLSPDPSYPVNQGMACPKGWEALRVLDSPDRATRPLLRIGKRLKPVSWETAATTFCERFKGIQAKHGPASVAWLGTGQLPTEELAFLGSFAKFGMGVVHGDGNTRQCMATAAVAYKQSFGFDAPPYTYADFEESDVIVLVGSNLCIAHPIMWERVCRNRHQPKIIVIDPRRTETAMAATHHVALAPKSDLHLLYGLAHLLIRENWIRREYVAAHTNDFDGFAAFVADYPPELVAAETGISESRLFELARLIADGKRVSFWWTMGVNQSYQGTRTAQAIINLALMTGNIGRPGTGANSITGQCNAMGSRLFSNTTNLLGHRDFTSADDREDVARALNIDAARIPTQASWSYDRIIEGIVREEIKGLWVVATNPAHSWINQNMLSDVLGRLDFLVVQDMYHTTETAQVADLVLPAAGWGEKEGTFINSERRIGLLKKVSAAPGEALSDFHIIQLLAEYWGCGPMFRHWRKPEDVFQTLQKLSRGRPCDITGIDGYRMLDQRGGVQWPYSEQGGDEARERRLFADGRFFHSDGRARFCFEAPRPMPEPPTMKYPLLLLTGRGTSAQWHTQTRTSQSPVLRKLAPRELYVELNPRDAREAKVQANQHVVVESQRGKLKARVYVTAAIKPGQAFLPMHYRDVNKLTHAHFDPYSRQPSYKNCAVRVRPLAAHDGDL